MIIKITGSKDANDFFQSDEFYSNLGNETEYTIKVEGAADFDWLNCEDFTDFLYSGVKVHLDFSSLDVEDFGFLYDWFYSLDSDPNEPINLELSFPKASKKLPSFNADCGINFLSVHVPEECEAYFIKDDVLYSRRGNSFALEFCPNSKTGTLVVIDGCKHISEWIFCGSQIENLVLPDSMTGFGEHSFMACDELKSIKFSAKRCSFGDVAFNGCPKLKQIELPADTELGDAVFNNCDSLEKITYAGTKAQWEKIVHGNCFWGMKEFTVHCSDGDWKGNN
jgi:hypothetical protein